MTHLVALPILATFGSVTLGVNVDNSSFVGTSGPPILEVVVRDLGEANLPRLAEDGSKEAMIFLAFLPIQDTGLGGVGETRDGRFDINVLSTVVIGVVLDAESGSGSIESLTSHPIKTLKNQDLVDIVAERLVLPWSSVPLPKKKILRPVYNHLLKFTGDVTGSERSGNGHYYAR